ncbi:bacteriophage T4 gp5 trimerisation domain-containing protein [Halodesulfovibrio aestuarii]|uniref:Gp5/Type VI secretion system Vgr C-terminal trimerisation domain-containing protein n=1 Tax=Halodesulfovibrio aestuarii TaxID=126333 RepID=A0ABV4JQU0_9BACT
MRDLIKKIVLRTFPELTAGLHLDRYARVIKVCDAPENGGTSERFRPRYAVDVEILTPEGTRDEAFPIYEAVPLPVPVGAGMESGLFAFPEAGALVVLGFAYGRADHPVIRQIYPMGLSLPQLTNGELRWQQSATVYQSADTQGNWLRISEATITDDSLRHVRRCVEAVDDLSRELRTIAENSSEEIGGVKTVEALGAMNLTSGGRTNIAAVDSLNLTTARDLRFVVADNNRVAVGKNQQTEVKGSRTSNIKGADSNTVGQNFTQTIAGNRTEIIGGKATQSVTGTISVTSKAATTHTAGGVFTIAAPKIKIGSAGGSGGGVSLLDEMLTVWQEVRDALHVLASHTHRVSGAATGTPNQSGVIAGHGDEVGECRGRVDGIRG